MRFLDKFIRRYTYYFLFSHAYSRVSLVQLLGRQQEEVCRHSVERDDQSVMHGLIHSNQSPLSSADRPSERPSAGRDGPCLRGAAESINMPGRLAHRTRLKRRYSGTQVMDWIILAGKIACAWLRRRNPEENVGFR